MSQLWLVPADERSYQRTLAEPVDLSDVADKPDEFPDRARVWGVRTDPEQGTWKRNRRNLDRMDRGDPLLIYRNGTGRYVATGQIGPFWETDYIRDEFWDGGPARHVYPIDGYEEVDIRRETINDLLGYEEQFWPQGLWRVADDRPTDRVLRMFG